MQLDTKDAGQQKSLQAHRFLKVFVVFVMVVAVVVSAVNLLAYRYMLRESNQSIVQLLAGWGRMYKPILYDEIKPQVAVYGASWARDAFDPTETGKLLGLTVFNHAVSGGTAYETRRFVDASMDNPRLQFAIINLDTFYRSELVARTRYGFDESILDVDPDLNPNRWVGLKRTYSLALTGWAAGANLKLMSTIFARDRGKDRSEYLEAYEQANHERRRSRMEMARQRIFPQADQPVGFLPQAEPHVPVSEDLDLLLDELCNNKINIIAYFTPAHVRQQKCDLKAGEARDALELLFLKQSNCPARIAYYHFAYPNAVTLEGVLTPVEKSQYYRPDGHPRPTMGMLMAARMFDRKFPEGTSELIRQDFGVDLMQHPSAESWLLERAARCEGDWGEDGYDEFKAALEKE